jgi:hypothetical protein
LKLDLKLSIGYLKLQMEFQTLMILILLEDGNSQALKHIELQQLFVVLT